CINMPRIPIFIFHPSFACNQEAVVGPVEKKTLIVQCWYIRPGMDGVGALVVQIRHFIQYTIASQHKKLFSIPGNSLIIAVIPENELSYNSFFPYIIKKHDAILVLHAGYRN